MGEGVEVADGLEESAGSLVVVHVIDLGAQRAGFAHKTHMHRFLGIVQRGEFVGGVCLLDLLLIDAGVRPRDALLLVVLCVFFMVGDLKNCFVLILLILVG